LFKNLHIDKNTDKESLMKKRILRSLSLILLSCCFLLTGCLGGSFSGDSEMTPPSDDIMNTVNGAEDTLKTANNVLKLVKISYI